MPFRKSFHTIEKDIDDWLLEIKDFLDGKKESLSDKILLQAKSKIGIWLNTDVQNTYSHISELEEFSRKHVKLHKIAQEIYDSKNNNQLALAQDFYEDLAATVSQLQSLLKSAVENISYVGLQEEQVFLENSKTAVVWDKSLKLIIETDAEGNVVFVNNNFAKVCGIDDIEFIGKPLSFYNSRDMPKIIYDMMVSQAKKQLVRPTVMKFVAKDGKYFWVLANYKVNKNANGTSDSYTFSLTGLNKGLLDKHIKPLYKKLKQIEVAENMTNCEQYLKNYLLEKNRDYDDFVLNLLMTGENTFKTDKAAKGGLLKRFGL
jgi:PAS domain S-box-containing protein